MPGGRPRTATDNETPSQRHIAVARALKRYMREHGLTVRQFNEQVLHETNPRAVTAYNWIAGRNLPSGQYIPLLAQALGKRESFFRQPTRKPPSRGNGIMHDAPDQQTTIEYPPLFDPQPEPAPMPAAPSAPPPVQPMPRAAAPKARQRVDTSNDTTPVMAFVVNHDGTATIELHYTAPLREAYRVFAGFVELGLGEQK